MKVALDIPEYDGNALDVIWNDNARYTLDVDYDSVILSANREGLISLAKQMIYFAYNELPEGSHIHFDSFFTKTDQTFHLVVEKKEE